MVGYKDTSDVAKKAAEVAQKKSNNWLMVIFIYNGNDIIMMGHSFKTKSTKSRATFFKITTPFLISSCRSLD